MEPIAPIAINVVLPSGEQVAQLMVNPEKSIMQMKTQIAGLEGTPVANQVLLLNDQQVEDADTLRSLNVSCEATFLLLRRAPLLSGAINREELEHLLEDNLALEQAIVAYSDSLQYLPSDITTISEEVAEGLVASGSGHDKAALLSGRQVELWQDIAKQTGKARQVAFSRALRKELERISAALPLGSVGAAPSTSHRRQRTASDDIARAELPQSAAPFAAPAAPAEPVAAEQLPDPAVSAVAVAAQPAVEAVQVAPGVEVARPAPKNARHYMQPLRHAEDPQGPQTPQGGRDAQPAAGPLDELNLRHIDVQKDDARFANHPWMGAGVELKTYLHRQWAVCEGESPKQNLHV